MKLVLFTHAGSEPAVGLLTERGVVPLARRGVSPQAEMVSFIDRFAESRAELERLSETAASVPVAQVQLLPPLPRPGKILCSTATYAGGRGALTPRPLPEGEGATRGAAERAQLLLTLKSAESVIGPGQTVQLPGVGDQWQFQPEAELGLVIRGPARGVTAAEWQRAVFGYTCVVDVMASGDTQFGRDFWLAKSDTLGPLGPCIVTADEIPDPQALKVRSWINGQLAQDYAMADADYTIGEQIELATTIMTLQTGDVLACGTSRAGLRPISNGDDVQVEISGVGRLQIRVAALSEVGA
ncbi:MAG: fumarylacetoacetate hydrolase family protein [Chloroflexi bacterium]|nr:fumarylacetoacetate hydrolase family protein [Chloroflexota bacterium]